MGRQELLARLAQPNERRIVLLVLDGVGDLRTDAQPRTALDEARTPNLDRLAARSALGRLVPVGTGITPGSGPGHLALFGYEPTSPEVDIGRGVLEALGLGLDVPPDAVVARCNFATVDEAGLLLDRRAGRIPSAEGERICARLAGRIEAAGGALGDGLEVEVHPGEAYRFVLLFRAADGTPPLDPGLADTDPQRLGVAALPVQAAGDAGESARRTADRIAPAVAALQAELQDEERANTFLLRGFSKLPVLPGVGELYRLRAAALAGYPLYRGVAKACGMEIVDCGGSFGEVLDRLEERWSDFEYFFLHVKGTDMAGEDGDLAAKVGVIESVDALLPRLLDLGPDVLAITGDHSTPAPMKAHSWHPVPLLLRSESCFVDECSRFTEVEAIRGAIGTIPASDLMGLLLANAGKLAKFGA
ncbi:MAG: 2,3-bisphosphoglycerate-independent phosphoglycerate mutase [Holophagales bacterium]|nr:2,3-bisphosphoglycerate-independent phosphoglycerate mutase [Holophagales bacterium]MYC11128.1 2,3-bisphosphoglycerate-independent phosphoglycerate mutase [Holophagales bacterium]